MVFERKDKLAVSGGLLALIVFVLGSVFLYEDKLGGPEFVALVIAFSLMGFAVAFAPNIQEVSLGGNVLKLKKAKREAEDTIEELRKVRIDTFRALLPLSLVDIPRLSSNSFSPVDGSVKLFWNVFDLIKEAGAIDDLIDPIAQALHPIIAKQHVHIVDRFSAFEFEDEQKICMAMINAEFSQARTDFCSPENVEKLFGRSALKIASREHIIKYINEAFDAYEKLSALSAVIDSKGRLEGMSV